VAQQEPSTPSGDVYDWYTRGLALLQGGDARAAIVVLQRVVSAEPESRAAREALARAEFASGEFSIARGHFAANLAVDPADDYAAFGVGLCDYRLGDHRAAVEHLAMAVAMRPGNHHYSTALRAARARAL
jgi:tetratricopeptide (TPR) repeat protein